METDLLKCAKELFMQKGLLEELKGFLSDMQRLDRSCNAAEREPLWTTLEAWRKQYLVGCNTVSVYGYLTWYLDIWVGEFRFPAGNDLKDNLLKMLSIHLLSDADGERFTDDRSIAQYLANEHDEWTECNSVTQLSHAALIEDWERFYAGSNRRLQNHMKKYKEHIDQNRRLADADQKYLQYIVRARNCSEIEQIIRINRLGERENGKSHHSESALYFISSSQSLYLVTFSDFA